MISLGCGSQRCNVEDGDIPHIAEPSLPHSFLSAAQVGVYMCAVRRQRRQLWFGRNLYQVKLDSINNVGKLNTLQ